MPTGWRRRTNQKDWIVYDKIGQSTFEEIEIKTFSTDNENLWFVIHSGGKARNFSKDFKTKSQAVSFALKYMREHPLG